MNHNIVLRLPGLKDRSIPREEPEIVWNALFDEYIISEILAWAKQRMATIKLKDENKGDLRDLDVI